MTANNSTAITKPIQDKRQGGNRKPATHKQFIAKARKAHGDKFCYEKTVYIHSQKRILITCKAHGDFEQIANRHLRSKHGCPKCAKLNVIKANTKNTVQFISKAKQNHGNKYDYSKSAYVRSDELITITCPEHGDFERTPASHLFGYGCNTCAGVDEYNTETFIKRAMQVHGDSKYDYSRSSYENAHKKLTIICSKHGGFEQSPAGHLQGYGCGACASELVSGYSRSDFVRLCNDKNGNAALYVIKCYDDCESFYKIGITSNDLQKRFQNRRAMPYLYDELYLIDGTASYIYDLEVKLHSLLKSWIHKPSVKFRGYTECFSTIKPIDKLLKKMSLDS
jgi:ssDNA-binding Zn-finger/Zn-ribbon topoisomerase 1